MRIVATSPRKEISSAGIEFIKATFFVIPQPIARLRLAILLSMVALRQGFVVQSFSLLQLAVHSVCLENNRKWYSLFTWGDLSIITLSVHATYCWPLALTERTPPLHYSDESVLF